MKKNDYLLLIATLAYSVLFYQQNAGINYLLFNLIILSIFLVRNNNLLKSKNWIWAAILCLVSSISIFINSSALSIIANISSLLILSAFSFNTKTSSLFSFTFSAFSMASSVVYIIIDCIKRIQVKPNSTENKKGYKILATIIVLFLSILFFNMYKSSNPLFAENTKWINLDFISFKWISFTIGGFIICYALFYHRTIEPIEKWENDLLLYNKPFIEDEKKQKLYETEHYAGLLLFIVLNLMLVILNVGDIQVLYLNFGLPKDVSHADFVHNGVGIIIFSIILATSLMMYLFRNNFTTIKNNKTLQFLSYIWIIQNIIMLSSTALRNKIYIHEYAFTYKRVGVYIWLLLAVLGLCILLYKILKNKSNWYLIKTNVAIWFSVLTISSVFNWDKIITNYNINNKPLKKVDFQYLFSLSDSNIPELIEVVNRPDFSSINPQLRKRNYEEFEQNYDKKRYLNRLNGKIYHYLSYYKKDWRSYDLRDKEIIESIYPNTQKVN
jgi:hypothetical protein